MQSISRFDMNKFEWADIRTIITYMKVSYEHFIKFVQKKEKCFYLLSKKKNPNMFNGMTFNENWEGLEQRYKKAYDNFKMDFKIQKSDDKIVFLINPQRCY